MIRKPAAAGRFYKANGSELTEEVRGFIHKDVKREILKGIISPHAGFIYSGQVAGAVFSKILIKDEDSFVIIGPNHSGRGACCSILTSGEWNMPNGNIPVDSHLAEKILSNSNFLEKDIKTHLNEHSIEVQLPFLQYFSKKFKIVPITISTMDFEACKDIGDAISKAINETNNSVTIIASSDMTHYESRISASKKDSKAIEYITSLDPVGLFNYVTRNNISMCGAAPVISTIIGCNNLNASSSKLIAYMTSGEISGDYDSVVGYAGISIK